MTTLLSKAEGQYQVLHFFCAVTGMRVSEAIAQTVDATPSNALIRACSPDESIGLAVLDQNPARAR